MPITIISFALILGFIIFFHELGHFTLAKLNGILVHEFAIGFGPTVWRHQGKETKYALRLFPLGGFVMMEGENEESESDRSFSRKTAWQRFTVLVAGALFNFITGFVMILLFMMLVGFPTTTIGEAVEGMPAYEAGLRAGDRILAVGGVETPTWTEITQAIAASGDAVDFRVERDGQTIDFSVRTRVEEGRRIVGIRTKETPDPGSALPRAWKAFTAFFVDIFRFFGELGKPGVAQNVVGPIGLFLTVGEVQRSGLLNLLFLAGFISVNIGVINLLPIPAFDGGRIVLVLIEMIIRRPIPRKFETVVNLIGVALIFTLFLFTLFNDLGRLRG
ncbi:MAG: M50 family metallopeptidase [Bacillota bacterium]|nr:M50 family metallopeptidase [Bacillota bacterium]